MLSSKRYTHAFFVFLAIAVCSSITPFNTQVVVDAAYVVSIPAKDEECYVIRSPGAAGGTLHGNFDLLDDGLSAEHLSVVIIDHKEEHVLFRSRRRASEGVFRVNLKPNQKVNLCLQNGLVTAGRGRKSPSARSHDGQDRIVGFEYSVDVKDENQEVHSQHEKNMKAATELTRAFGNLVNHHQYMRTREGKHRELVEKTFGHLMWWVILEGIMVVGVAGAQIMYFRNFLEKRRYM